MIVPKIGAIIELPNILDPARSARFMRIHGKIIKEALKEELIHHHRHRLEKHWSMSARFKYGHKKRKPGTIARKKKAGKPLIDLLESGESRSSMLRGFEELRVGGGFTREGKTRGGKGIRATMILRWPFPLGDNKNADGVTVEQMAKEIETFTDEEQQEIAASLKKRYVKKVGEELSRGSRIRKRILASGVAL